MEAHRALGSLHVFSKQRNRGTVFLFLYISLTCQHILKDPTISHTGIEAQLRGAQSPLHPENAVLYVQKKAI